MFRKITVVYLESFQIPYGLLNGGDFIIFWLVVSGQLGGDFSYRKVVEPEPKA